MNKLVLAALITTVSAVPFAVLANEAPNPAEPAAVTATVAVEVKTVAGELKDGTKIEITGEKVEVIGKDGKKTPAPDGEHTLKDGSKVTTKAGMIVKK